MNITSISASKRFISAAKQENCLNCRVASFCVAANTGRDKQLGQLTTRRIRMARDARLFQEGDLVGDRFYAIRYGSIKYSLPNASGQHKICAFLMSGELLGLDAIELKQHSGTAIALEDCEVCEIRYSDMKFGQKLLHGLLSKQIVREQIAAHLLRKSSAEQRLAAFLLEMSWRYQQRGYSPHCFRLVMQRQDIANFLALSPECLSRELSHFQDIGLLSVDEREITLYDIGSLRELATGTAPAARTVGPWPGRCEPLNFGRRL